MKKLLTFLLVPYSLSLIPSVCKAQITIHESDMVQIGHDYLIANDTTPTVTQGGAGTGQTWTLTGIKDQRTDTASCVTPGSTPYYSDFTSANIASHVPEKGITVYEYANLTAGSYTSYGDYVLDAAIKSWSTYSPADEIISFPAAYSNKWSGTSRVVTTSISTPGDTIVIFSKVSNDDTVDGSGTVTTPAGTYSAIRIVNVRTQLYDSEYTYTTSRTFLGTSGIAPSTISYTWYATGKGYAVATVNLLESGPSVFSATYLKSSILSIDEVNANAASLVYPNPSSSIVNITLKSSSEDGYVKVMDITGRDVETSALHNGKAALNTTAYSNGMYLYMLTDVNGNMLDKGKFIVNH